MAINTLITIKDSLQLFVDQHQQLQRVVFGADDARAQLITESELFPMLYVAPVDVLVGEAHNTHRLRVYVYEKLNEDVSDFWENANDTSLMLRDIRVWWNAYNADSDILIAENPTGQIKTDAELDGLVGYFAEILFQIPSHGRCDVPLSPVVYPPLPTCAPVTYNVEYANGDPIASGTEPSGGNIEVIVPNPITCNPASFTLINTDETVLVSGTISSGGSETITAPDADISLNGVAFPSIASGGSDNIQVRRATGSTQVGSKQGQYWRIANTTVQLKDTANNNIGTVNSYAAETANNLTAPDATANVTIDGSPFQTVNIPSGGSATIDVPSWTRPADWLPMPTVLPTDQTFVGLYAIFPSGNNFAAFRFTTDTGDYQVDWGDGTITTHASNATAEHTYDYATYDPTNATLTTRGYKQAMIVVTPLTGNLTTCDFQFRRTTTPAQNQAYATGFLDCILSMPNANTGGSIEFGGGTVAHRYVERFDVKTIGGCTSMQNMFLNCNSLQSVPLFDTANVTNMSNMFLFCVSLQSVPLFDTANVSNMQNMFNNCNSLQTVPLFNTANVTTMQTMFNICSSLQSVPLFNTSNVTTVLGMFNACNSLQSVPLFDTANVSNMQNMFNNCNSFDRTDIICSVTVGFQNCQLSRDEIVNIFNNLLDRTLLPSANINVSGNWGASALTAGDIAIATAKNWTVTT